MSTVKSPIEVPDLSAQPGGRSVPSGIRTCAVVMSDAADVMHRNSAPEGFEGDPAVIANHAMTSTATDVEGAVAALQVGLVALDAFCDRMDRLRSQHTELVGRHTTLDAKAVGLREREAAADPTVAVEITSHNSRVSTFDADVATWEGKVTKAEDRLIASLRSADTTTEGKQKAKSAPNVPDLKKQAQQHAGDPAALFAWWQSLSRAEREALKVSTPELIGNLDGIPIDDRDEANRAHLSGLYNTLKQQEADGEGFSDKEADLMEKLTAIHKGLDKADDQTDDDGNPIPTYLMVFDPKAADGDGHAAIAFGNPETADHVSVNVPGLTSTMNNFDGVSGDAAAVREAADRMTDGTVASIAWLGYDAPSFDMSISGVRDVASVTGEGPAADGAKNLSSFIDGLKATRSGDQPHYTAVGHSYGSVLVSKAAGGDMRVDDVVLVGNPGAGSGNRHASDLHGNVYVGSSDEDFVTRLGNDKGPTLGRDPANESFGATRFKVETQGDFAYNGDGFKRGLENHTSYFDDADTMEKESRGSRDSDSLVNVGKVVSGHGETVEQVPGRKGNNYSWWSDEAGEDVWNEAKKEWNDAKKEFGQVKDFLGRMVP